jgi:dihydroorotate dehydrogenase (fumarate)
LASPLGDSEDKFRYLEDHGIAAVVLPPLCEEQLIFDGESVDADLSRGAEAFSESSTFLPELGGYNLGPEGCLELRHKANKQVSIPIIASLNGVTPGLGALGPRNRSGRRGCPRIKY